MPALLINGVDAATFGFVLTESPSWIDLPPRMTPSQAVINRQGAIITAPSIESARKVTLNGFVTSVSVAATRANLDALKIALTAAAGVQLIFQDNSTRYITCTLDNFAVLWAGPALIERRLRVSISMTAFDPYFYDTTVTSIASGNSWPLGTAITRPVITITGASTNPVITLLNKSGAVMNTMGLTITTIAGDSLVMDHDARTIKKNGTSIISSLTSGDFFAVDPSDSANYGTPGPSIASSGVTGTLLTTYRKTWR